MKLILCFLVLILLIGSSKSSSPHDLIPPHNSVGVIQKYITIGSTTIADKWLTLTPKNQNSKGSLWGKKPNQYRNWEATFQFMINGISKEGGDGMGFWYTHSPLQLGDLFGSNQKFTGLGVFLHTNPLDGEGERIQVMIGDGRKVYDKTLDGANVISHECETKLRNKGLLKLHIKLNQNELEVLYDTTKSGNWDSCIKIPNVNLPTGYYFGFSAKTSELFDNHILREFTVINVDSSKEEERIQQKVTTNNGLQNSNIKVKEVFGIELSQYTEIQNQYDELLTYTETLLNKVDKFTKAHAELYALEKFLSSLQEFVKQNTHDIFDLKRQIDTELTKYISLIAKDHREVDRLVRTFRNNISELSTLLTRSSRKTSGIADSIKDETIKLRQDVQKEGHSIGWIIIIIQVIFVLIFIMRKNKSSKKDKYY
ncbi:vesicular mannose-binding lectin [Anaeramoeba flamelloides]|uniref:Vesicular mannose-binding lectin n=1 Tax=Anaeramoeba flamelloides TaxID=1746091 RepID=A0ABQ8YT10_9EUKA|nr:vesicular mannose-binding lectin [Anaeramoeba flamelloides]